jgi:O-antigen/teichoic acid export membrane protein
MLIIIPGIVIDSVCRTIFSWYKGTGKPKIVSYFSAGSLILNIIFNIFLIPIWGLYGAGFSLLFTYIIKSSILVLFYRKSYYLSFRDILLIKRDEIVNLKMHYFNNMV